MKVDCRARRGSGDDIDDDPGAASPRRVEQRCVATITARSITARSITARSQEDPIMPARLEHGPLVALMRHGETSANLENRFQGQSDGHMHEIGSHTMRNAAHRLRAIRMSRVYCSTLIRSQQSADIMCRGRSMDAQVKAGFGERHLGTLDGRCRSDVMMHDPSIVERLMSIDYAPENGETGRSRLTIFSETLSTVLREPAHHLTLIVSHGGAIALFARHVLGLDPDRCFLHHGAAHLLEVNRDGSSYGVLGAGLAPSALAETIGGSGEQACPSTSSSF